VTAQPTRRDIVSNITATRNNEDGFTLIDMVVSMTIGGLLTIMIFNLFNTAMEVSEIAAKPVANTIATQSALDALGKAVRNSPEQRVTEDGSALYVLNQENEYTVWHIGDDGLSNGSRSYKDVKDVRFKQADGSIQAAFTTGDDTEITRSFRSRFPDIAEEKTVFTDTFLDSHAPTD
jgi:type II secretory pathway component PulJ